MQQCNEDISKILLLRLYFIRQFVYVKVLCACFYLKIFKRIADMFASKRRDDSQCETMDIIAINQISFDGSG
ncbi:MAG: hypothetical protein DCC59_04880 [Chloroflexi bacterium]|nr:hypothetical protein [Chloroflexota bacterium]RIK54169.1 MAG: hypothetical protein DCC59_04880 [Chloroflexota bacterium]